MATYRFKVTFEDHDEVSRDIEIRSTQTFDDLHQAIHSAIGFDGAKPSSFYMSDDNWKKGKEITSKPIAEDDTTKYEMKKARLCDFIVDPHQKIYYIFDFSSHWTFRIELIKINREEDPHAKYPRCVKSTGEAPKQFNNPTIAAIPIPEDFDLLEDIDDEEDEDEAEEAETDVLGIDVAELPEGEEKDESFTAAADEESSDEEFGDEDMMDDSLQEGTDEF